MAGLTEDQTQGFFKKQTRIFSKVLAAWPDLSQRVVGTVSVQRPDRKWAGLMEHWRVTVASAAATRQSPGWDGEQRETETWGRQNHRQKLTRLCHRGSRVCRAAASWAAPAQPLRPGEALGRLEYFLLLPRPKCDQRPAASHRGSVLQELVSGRPSSGASWALACRWARAELECRHLGDPQRQLNSLPLMSQKRCP